ncbi:MAG: LysM peptidoglycan-binding domain-containing protein [Limnohabitans sp.]|nr:LysM peptidoglycan-binding domain-containing protein [Limnohabitans sp.]
MNSLTLSFIFRGRLLITSCVLALLGGCISSGRYAPAPIEDRQRVKPPAQAKTTPAAPVNPKPVPQPAPVVAEPPPKSAYYIVKPGDTLIKIGLEHGQNWRDIIRWNSIDNPNIIDAGQILRIMPPMVEPGTEPVVVKPVTNPGQMVNTGTEAKPAAVNNPQSAVGNPDEATVFSWPATGNVSAAFDDLQNKGIDISGKTGDAVYAAADGRVVYAGAGLRGYGNLVIVKHANNFLTAYAHNQSLLVREDQSVKRGQKIAEMGNSDSEQVKLHFEIRKQGKPVDPVKLLPPR